jgi:hypothetical protein
MLQLRRFEIVRVDPEIDPSTSRFAFAVLLRTATPPFAMFVTKSGTFVPVPVTVSERPDIVAATLRATVLTPAVGRNRRMPVIVSPDVFT